MGDGGIKYKRTGRKSGTNRRKRLNKKGTPRGGNTGPAVKMRKSNLTQRTTQTKSKHPVDKNKPADAADGDQEGNCLGRKGEIMTADVRAKGQVQSASSDRLQDKRKSSKSGRPISKKKRKREENSNEGGARKSEAAPWNEIRRVYRKQKKRHHRPKIKNRTSAHGVAGTIVMAGG